MLTENEFEVLYSIKKTGRVAEEKSKYSATYKGSDRATPESFRVVESLIDRAWITQSDSDSYQITLRGEQALLPYKVDNAIIMAAGLSSRFAPLSYEKPKGLLNVKGEVLIEREIRQLQEAGISEIILVVGYKKELFGYLQDKFGVRIVENEDFYRYNNTSTIMRVLDDLKNSYICSSDNYFRENVFEPYVYRGYYSAIYAEGETDEYCLTVDADDRIIDVQIGGSDSWYMLGHVYWDRAFSENFRHILKKAYAEAATKQMLWENLYMEHLQELDLRIRRYPENVILEFDSLDELRQFDTNYRNNTGSPIMEHISKKFNCDQEEILEIRAEKNDVNPYAFCFSVNGRSYLYRHPARSIQELSENQQPQFGEILEL